MQSRRTFLSNCTALAASSYCLPIHTLADDAETLAVRTLPGTDETMAIIGYGNSRAFQTGDLELSRQLLDIFLQRGGNYVDTSGAGRYTVGKIMRERQAHDQLFLGTYVDTNDDTTARKEIREVLSAQGGESLDLVLTRSVEDFAKRRAEYDKLKEDGLTRYIGVARQNERYYPSMMKLIEANAVDVIQVNYSLLEPEAEQRIIPMAQDNGVAILTNRPFINGRYFSLIKDRDLPEWAGEFDCYSWAQFSLKFIVSNPAVNCVLTETADPKHAIDNLTAGFGRLPDAKTRKRMIDYIRDLA